MKVEEKLEIKLIIIIPNVIVTARLKYEKSIRDTVTLSYFPVSLERQKQHTLHPKK